MFVEHRDEPALMGTGNEMGAMTYELRPSEFTKEFVSVEPTMPTRHFIPRQANETLSERLEGLL